MQESNLPRIVFVTGRLDMGGATTFLCNLAGELVRQGVPCLVLNFEANNGHAEDFEHLGIEVVLHDSRRLIFEDVVASILNKIAGFQPTAVVANLDTPSYEVLRRLPAGVRRVAICHSADRQLYKTMAPFAPWFDDVVGVSEHVADELRALPEFQRARIHYLSCGVSVPDVAPVRDLEPGDPLRIIYFGRLVQEAKRVRLFPRIWDQLLASGIPFCWTIAGDGPERDFLESQMKSASPTQQVRFTGTVAYRSIPALLQQQDVYLLTSDYEGGPLSLLEAMAYGVVPVVSDLPTCIRQAVDAQTGIRVQPSDIEGYAAGIIHLHQHRAELACKSAFARERILSSFSSQVMARKWIETALAPQLGECASWPSRFRAAAPLGADGRFAFSRMGRLLRRLRKFLRALL